MNDQKTEVATEERTAPVFTTPSRWPGLIPWLTEGFFRTLGYAMLFCAGVAFTRENAVIGVIGAIMIGHISICTSEVVARMSERGQEQEQEEEEEEEEKV